MKLTLAFSPCPNDTFIFDALVNGKIDTQGLSFEVLMTDVEELNQLAFENKIDVTKISYHAYAYLTNKYALCHAGSALGNNVGPLLICRNDVHLQDLKSRLNDLSSDVSIAIPGKYTTANFLLSLAFPNARNKKELLFSAIEDAVINKEVDAGLIIHENRFTYAERGLQKIIDCGEFWQTNFNAPIPLGGIVVKRNLPKEVQEKVSELIAESIRYAFKQPESSKDFVRAHAQEMSESVIQQHINLYVNNYSIDLGEDGRSAITTLFETAKSKGIISDFETDLFV